VPHSTDDPRGRAHSRTTVGLLVVLVASLVIAGFSWLRSSATAAVVSNGLLLADEDARTALGTVADVRLALELPAIQVQAQGLADLRDATVLESPTAAAVDGGFRLTIVTDTAPAGEEILGFLAVYLMTWAGESEIQLATARLDSITDQADAARVALDTYESEVGVVDVAGALGRVDTELLRARTELAAASDPGAAAALDRRVATLESRSDALSDALPTWRLLRIALDEAHAELVAATVAEDVTISEANLLATHAVIDSVSSTNRSNTGGRVMDAAIAAGVSAAIGAGVVGALARRRRIIEETVAASRQLGPEPPTGPGQFSGPDPRVTAAVVRRPAEDLVSSRTATRPRKRFSVRAEDPTRAVAR